jgi:hypothetical protein
MTDEHGRRLPKKPCPSGANVVGVSILQFLGAAAPGIRLAEQS